ncbi:Pro-Pol polyprotein [Araneus ventricosus]|uniref:Pro-Pol polyprotein n=1 Tax=Araneus ventricosus TaxID=182803 RepID=A0A4Y2AS01_ARAVE|nr:Pro-Pol polyprotein [Araneus ventricosus]
MSKTQLTPKIARWALFLEDFNYEIVHRPECILYNKKHGKGEGFLNPIPKDNVPLNTYHIDFVGPLPSTNKRYQHIFTVVDAFTKFTWFYPVKSPSAQEAIDKLKLQQTIFCNPSRILTDRGSAFTANEFDTYCSEEGIQHLKITTGIPRGNGQIEWMHRILIPVFYPSCPTTKWFKHVPTVQRVINSSISRSTKYTPFELMLGTKMKNKDIKVNEVLHEEYLNYMMHERDEMRNDAKKNILKVQEENRRNYDKKRKKSTPLQGWRLRCDSANTVWDWPQAATKILRTLRSD